MAIEERVSGIQLSQENENLKAEIRDLNEKLETLKGINALISSFCCKTDMKELWIYSAPQPRQRKTERGG